MTLRERQTARAQGSYCSSACHCSSSTIRTHLFSSAEVVTIVERLYEEQTNSRSNINIPQKKYFIVV